MIPGEERAGPARVRRAFGWKPALASALVALALVFGVAALGRLLFPGGAPEGVQIGFAALCGLFVVGMLAWSRKAAKRRRVRIAWKRGWKPLVVFSLAVGFVMAVSELLLEGIVSAGALETGRTVLLVAVVIGFAYGYAPRLIEAGDENAGDTKGD